MALKFLKNMAKKYNFVYVPFESSIYIDFKYGNNADFQLAKWYKERKLYVVFSKCVIFNNTIYTSADPDTWLIANTNEQLEKELIKFLSEYKKFKLKLKINSIEKDFE